MLVLARKAGETIKIGHNTHVTVMGVAGNAVRLGVNAPEDRSIHRQEVYERIQFEKQQSDVLKS